MLESIFTLSSIIAVVAVSLVIPDASPSLFLYDKLLATDKRLQTTFRNKRVWITGASSGLGAEIAHQLAGKTNAKLILSGRREAELHQVQRMCSESGGKDVFILPFDVTEDDEQISRVVSSAIEFYDGIDILILNAGAGQLSPAQDDSLATTRALMEVNYIGPVRLAMEVMKQDRWGEYSGSSKSEKKRGHLVVTSSVASKMALPLGTSYAASKHAVHGYFSSLRSECAEWLRVDLPCPGPIATEFQSNVLSGTSSSSDDSDSDSDGEEDSSEVKMPVDRCAKLILSSMMGPAGIMQETWISRQPTLAFMFINQYLPSLSTQILGLVGPLRLKAFRAGLPLYEVSSWIKAAKMDREEVRARAKDDRAFDKQNANK